MKKLMFAAATAAALVGMADIESTNIVGYTNGPETVDQFNFLSIGFNTVGCNTMDIQQLVITGDGIGWGGEVFSVWAGGPDVVEGSDFIYWDASMDPTAQASAPYWGDGDCNKATFSIAAGQGVVVQCAAELGVLSAGEVPRASVDMETVDGFNFIGNPFPTAIDIQAVKVTGDGTGWGGEVFSVWAGGPEVIEGSDFIYWDASMDPEALATEAYWGDDGCNKVTYPLAAGQSFVIQCAEGLTVTLVPPYQL